MPKVNPATNTTPSGRTVWTDQTRSDLLRAMFKHAPPTPDEWELIIADLRQQNYSINASAAIQHLGKLRKKDAGGSTSTPKAKSTPAKRKAASTPKSSKSSAKNKSKKAAPDDDSDDPSDDDDDVVELSTKRFKGASSASSKPVIKDEDVKPTPAEILAFTTSNGNYSGYGTMGTDPNVTRYPGRADAQPGDSDYEH